MAEITKVGFQLGSSLGSKHLTDAEYIKGGYFVVDTYNNLTSKYTIATSTADGTIIEGSLCYCQEDSKFYQFDGTNWLEAKLGKTDTITITDTTPEQDTYYYPIYSTEVSGEQVARANKDLYYYDSGTWSALNIGSSSNAGILTLHQNNGKYGNLQVINGLSENRTYTLPDKSGTVALLDDVTVTKVADLTGNITATDLAGKLKGTTSTTLAAGDHTHDNYAPTSHDHSDNSVTLEVSNEGGQLVWGQLNKIATIAGTTISVRMPAEPSSSSANKTGTKLYLIGATNQSDTPTTYSNSNVFINTSNQVQATGFYASSDRRLKENIKEFVPQTSILDLPVVEFDFKDSGTHQIGCIAQDLQEICPEIVNADDNGYLSISESKLSYLLLLELKKLREEFEAYKASKE